MRRSAAYAGPAAPPVNPLLLISVAVMLGGLLVAANKVSIWIAPAVLAIAVVGMVTVWLKRRGQTAAMVAKGVDYGRLARTDVRPFTAWLKENVRGQDDVVNEVMNGIEQGLGLARPGRTVGAFMLVGPTGTGKTFLASLVGQAMYGESATLVLRMNQYKHPQDVFTLIGPPPGMPGYEVGGRLTRPVLDDPYRVIVLDELEKAHPDVHHCLYDVLDTGSCLEKSSGKVVDFSACVFFATCNAGVELLRAHKAKGGDMAAWLGRSRDALSQAGGFDKAFLARFTGIHLMDELEPRHVAEVACMQLARHWQEYGIEVSYASPEVILDAVMGNEEFKSYGVRQLGAYVRERTNAAISSARHQGRTRVALDVAPDRSLIIRDAS